jgi:divinyl chlorophyllide a 8-vinyl-reductase
LLQSVKNMNQSQLKGRRVLVVGATGYIGQQVVRELVARGHQVVCVARRRAGIKSADDEARTQQRLAGAQVVFAEVSDAQALEAATLGLQLDAVISCLATRTGGVADAWRIEHEANLRVLELARRRGATHFILLSAICVQKPLLAFQHAKLAFEQALMTSGLTWSIVRPTAFFKSLAGQIERVKRGKPFLVFGDGTLTACKPISEADLARFISDCLDEASQQNAVLPIGGPGAALTPLEQGALVFEACGKPPAFRHVPVKLFDAIIFVLSLLARVVPSLADKAEYARIGRYYATESMLVLDPATGRYDAATTPGFGSDTLAAFYARVAKDGLAGQELGDHAL